MKYSNAWSRIAFFSSVVCAFLIALNVSLHSVWSRTSICLVNSRTDCGDSCETVFLNFPGDTGFVFALVAN